MLRNSAVGGRLELKLDDATSSLQRPTRGSPLLALTDTQSHGTRIASQATRVIVSSVSLEDLANTVYAAPFAKCRSGFVARSKQQPWTPRRDPIEK
jgi:hypothetical protein